MSDLTKVCPMCGAEYGTAQTFCSTDGATLRPKVEKKGDLTDTVVADRYRVVKKLGEGGMGQVYLAEHVRIKRKSALKVMRPDVGADPDAIARFTREATNASHIEHPNVASIHDFGETSDGVIYLAMEFVEGEALSALLGRDGAMSAERVAGIVDQTAAGLQAAHDLGIVHRDLKPDNIMIARHRSGADKVKIVDFGIAKVTKDEGQKVTTTGVMIGTPAYMSPEQVAGGTIDGLSDQFSLACTAFEMLTGELPFEGSSTYEQITSRIAGQSRRLRQVRGDVTWPSGLEEVLQRAMSPQPADRFPTVTDFAKALRQALETRAASPTPEQGTLVMRESDLPKSDRPVVPPTRPAAPPPAASAASAPAPAKSGRGTMIGIAAAVLVAVGGGAAFLFSDRGAATPSAEQSPTPSESAPLATRATASSPPTTLLAKPTAADMPAAGRRGDGAAAPVSAPTGAPADARSTAPAVAAPAPGAPGGPPSTGTPAPTTPSAAAPPTSAPAAPPAQPAAAPDARAEISRVRDLAASDNDDENREAISRSQSLLAKVTTRADSILVLYHRARAHASLGETSQACRQLGRAGEMAEGTMRATITRTKTTLECP